MNKIYLKYLKFSLIFGFYISIALSVLCYILDALFLSLKESNEINNYQWYWRLMFLIAMILLIINALFILITFISLMIFCNKIKKNKDVTKVKNIIDFLITWTGFFSFYYYWILYKNEKSINKNWNLICSLKLTLVWLSFNFLVLFISLNILDLSFILIINLILFTIFVIKLIMLVTLIYYQTNNWQLNKVLLFFKKYGRYIFLDLFFK